MQRFRWRPRVQRLLDVADLSPWQMFSRDQTQLCLRGPLFAPPCGKCWSAIATRGQVSSSGCYMLSKAHRTLSVRASGFERRVSGDTRFRCSAQCAGSVPLGSSFLPLPPGVRNTRRVE